MKIFFFALLIIISLSGCASNSIDLTISSKFSVTDLTKIKEISKTGDFLVAIGENQKKLAITENDYRDLSNDIGLPSQDFFDHIFNEDEDKSTTQGQIVNEFRIGLLLEGYTSKESVANDGVTVYIWHQGKNKFVAIVADHKTNYFLNILGENVDSEKIKNIVKNK